MPGPLSPAPGAGRRRTWSFAGFSPADPRERRLLSRPPRRPSGDRGRVGRAPGEPRSRRGTAPRVAFGSAVAGAGPERGRAGPGPLRSRAVGARGARLLPPVADGSRLCPLAAVLVRDPIGPRERPGLRAGRRGHLPHGPAPRAQREHRPRVARVCASSGLAFIDPRPDLRSATQTGFVHGPRDWKHFNRRGYTVLAEAIAHELGRVEGPPPFPRGSTPRDDCYVFVASPHRSRHIRVMPRRGARSLSRSPVSRGSASDPSGSPGPSPESDKNVTFFTKQHRDVDGPGFGRRLRSRSVTDRPG